MPIVLLEKKKGSRSALIAADVASSRLELRYLLAGTMDDALIHTFLKSGILPPTYGGMFKQRYRIDCIGWGAWDVVVEYEPLVPKEPGQSVTEFEIGGGTAHITHSRLTVERYSWIDGQEAPDYEGAIGVTDGTVEGCDVHAPGFTWTETHWIPAPLVTAAYLALLDEMTPSVNAFAWRWHEAGEVLFLGVRGALRGPDYYEMSYRFARSRNRDDIKIGGDVAKVIYKEGWQYAWTRFANKKDEVAKATVRVPVSTHVEDVYAQEDFYNLGIG